MRSLPVISPENLVTVNKTEMESAFDEADDDGYQDYAEIRYGWMDGWMDIMVI